MLNNSLFSSKTDLWSTPQTFFDTLHTEFQFEVDVCATSENAKCETFFTPETDGLSQKWAPKRCWMNPPYGKTIKTWMAKALNESRKGALVVCLVPARTDTAWWHDFATKGEVRFIRGRLKFGNAKQAPFPCAVVIFKPNCPTSYA